MVDIIPQNNRQSPPPNNGPDKPIGFTGRPSLVLALGSLSAFTPLAIDMYLPAIPSITRDLNAAAGTVQMALPVFLAGLALGQLFWGSLSDRLGRRRPLLTGCLLFALAGSLCALAPSAQALVAARLAMGFSGAVGLAVSRAIVRDLCDEQDSARMYSLIMVVSGLAPIVAPYLGGLVLAYASWRVVFWILTLFGLACLALVFVSVPETLKQSDRVRSHERNLLREYLELLTNRRFAPALVLGLTCGTLFACLSGVSFVFIEIFQLSPQRCGFLLMTNGLGLYITARLNAWLLRRWGVARLVTLGVNIHAAAAVALLGVAWTHVGGVYLFYACQLVSIAALGLIFPNATALAMAPFPRQAGSAAAMLGTLQYGLGALAGSAVGLMHNGTALPMAFTMALCGLGAWILLCWLGTLKRIGPLAAASF